MLELCSPDGRVPWRRVVPSSSPGRPPTRLGAKGPVVLELRSPTTMRPSGAPWRRAASSSSLGRRVAYSPPVSAPPPPSTTSAPRLNPRHALYCRTRTGRRATWAAHGDYLLVLSSTRISCQRHRRARVATRYRPWRHHRPSAIGQEGLNVCTRVRDVAPDRPCREATKLTN